jgi:hypothetical protein
MHRNLKFLICATALAAGSAPTAADADAAKVSACVDEMVGQSVAQGRRLRAADYDAVANQEALTYRVTLYKGMTYVLLGCADGEGVDLDIRLYDDKGELVDNDASPDAKPFVAVEPPVTGEYALQLILNKATAPKTDVGVAITYQF